MSNICILIPAYNEEKNIGRVIEQARQFINEVVVVNDGSSDNTAGVAEDKGAVCLCHDYNRGKGASLQTGFEYILTKKDITAIVVMDADGQHDPNELPDFLELFKDTESDLILGNRMLDPSGMPFLRKLTNRVMSTIISRICKQNIPDSQCGYRLINQTVLEKTECSSLNYDWDSEILIKAARAGFKIGWVKIRSIYNAQKSKINPFSDTIRFLNMLRKI